MAQTKPEMQEIYTATPWSSVTIHPSYIVVKPLYNLLPPNKPSQSSSTPKKTPIEIRNKRLRELGFSYDGWKTFITLTFAPYHYGVELTTQTYDAVQYKFRNFVKYLKKTDKNFIYLAVLEHGGRYGRIHYHMLTNLDFEDKKFVKFKHKYKKIMPMWKYGFSDVVSMYHTKGAVGYLLKYVGKNGKRTPVGKREIFHSNEIGKVYRINCSWDQAAKIVEQKQFQLIDSHHDCQIYAKIAS